MQMVILKTKKMLLEEKMKIILLKPKKKLLPLKAQPTKMPLLKMLLLGQIMMQEILKKSKTKMGNQSQKKRNANAQQKLKKFGQKK